MISLYFLAAQVQEQLGLHSQAAQRRGAGGPGSPQTGGPGGRPGNRFILPLSECEFAVNQALEELQRDAFPAVAASRPSRALGTAVAVAAALMGGCLPAGSGAARLMLLVGGACTEGGGKVVDKELTEPIRWGPMRTQGLWAEAGLWALQVVCTCSQRAQHA